MPFVLAEEQAFDSDRDSATWSVCLAQDDTYRDLIQGFGLQGDIGFAGSFFLGVFFHPGFPALSSGGIAPGESQGGDVSVGDGDFFVGVLGEEADHGISQRGGGAAVEEIAFDF
jgi:hypothetical protein